MRGGTSRLYKNSKRHFTMISIQILEPNDIVKATDWCRPLLLVTMCGGHSDYYSFESDYSGTAQNNVKWVRIRDVFGPRWFGKAAKEFSKYTPHEIVRGSIPKKHQLTGHKSLHTFFADLKKPS